MTELKTGDKAICSQCGQGIVFIGPHWDHPGEIKPKHPATPAEQHKIEINLREYLGRVVRDAWVTWASEQPSPKPHHLDPWEALPEPIKEVDRRIGIAVMEALKELSQ